MDAAVETHAQPSDSAVVRRWWSVGLTCAAAGLFGVSAIYFRDSAALATLDNGMTYVLLGAVALLVAYMLHHPPVPMLRPAPQVSPAPDARPRLQASAILKTLVGIIALVVLVAINSYWLPPESAHIQMVLLVGGIVLVAMGLTPSPSPLANSGLKPTVQHGKHGRGMMDHARTKNAYWLLAAMTILALGVRLWDLENGLHIFMDEVNFVDGVNGIRDGYMPGGLPIFILHPFSAVAAFPFTYPYLQYWSVQVFGPTLSAIRLPSVIIGALTIPALFWMASALFDRKTAFIAAFALAVFPPHIHFSRLGMNNIADPFFGVLVIGFVARALISPPDPARTRHDLSLQTDGQQGENGRGMMYHARTASTYWTLAGVCLGLTQYWYEGGRLLFPALVVGWLLLAAACSWIRREQANGMLRMLAVAAIIALPYYFTQVQLNFPTAPRLQDRGHTGDYVQGLLDSSTGFLRTYWDMNLRPAVLHFFYTPDGGQFFYGGETALILPFLLPVFFLGVFHALFRLKLPGLLVLMWLALTALGNSLLDSSDWTARFAVSLPALPLVLAIGVRYTWHMIFEPPRRQARQESSPQDMNRQDAKHAKKENTQHSALSTQSSVLILSILLLAAGWAQVTYYFGPHLEVNNRQVRRFQYDFHDVMFRARELEAETRVFLISDEDVWWPQIATIGNYWQVGIALQVMKPDEVNWDYFASLGVGTKVAFFVKPGYYDMVTRLRKLFVLGEPQMSPFNVPIGQQYVMYVGIR
jgi:4-amino-4-deoxy-L-arabinose transferase-like glycosyltransferase